MKISFIVISICFLAFSEAKSQQWSQSTGYDTLFVQESFSGLTQIHVAGQRVFTTSLRSDFNYVVYYSDDNGITWNGTTSDNTTGSHAVFANVDSDTIYSFGNDLFGTRYLRKSTDAGESWLVQSGDFSGVPITFVPLRFVAISDTLLMTSSARNAGILKSVDGGASWESFISFSDNDQNKAINGLEKFREYFFLSASSNGKGLFRSHKDSTHWEKIFSIEAINESIYGFSIDSEGVIYTITDQGVQYSEDLGDTWNLKTYTELEIPELGTPTHVEISGENLLIAVANGAEGPSVIRIKKDFSTLAEDISDGLLDMEVTSRILSFETTSTSAFATRVGLLTTLYVHVNEDISTSSEFESSKNTFYLDQNYPNPFNPSTNISFNLPEATEVSLKVYNMLGQEVASLVDGRMNAGFKQVLFDASLLSSGNYIYRLKAGSNVITKKMILIK